MFHHSDYHVSLLPSLLSDGFCCALVLAVSADPLCFATGEELRGELLQRLRAALTDGQGHIDGVLLAMHGNMCVGNIPGAAIDLDPGAAPWTPFLAYAVFISQLC